MDVEMPFYSYDAIESLYADLDKWLSDADDIAIQYMARKYKEKRSYEYAHHGFSRRLLSMIHNSKRIFEVLPPNLDENPRRDNVMDATSFLHAFLMNVYGAIDNLARIWCVEAGVKTSSDMHIGFRKKNATVRDTLSNELTNCLNQAEDWFEYLDSYRHSVAHRIPVYIPFSTIDETSEVEYNKLENELKDAIHNKNANLYYEVFFKQQSLGVFKPVMMHSFGENARPVFFHGQIICDIATVTNMSKILLKDLEGLS